ncbi:GPRNNB1 [Cordylochernes scorpioides]|uniref:GPRNNB1 n=1 Tax=Cordylochernes scorpioides TaxID=51811 RepID=A0ABY6JX60_9ARAC|nr:GPRNNB1 [Cordylochernes scorpioides]
MGCSKGYRFIIRRTEQKEYNEWDGFKLPVRRILGAVDVTLVKRSAHTVHVQPGLHRFVDRSDVRLSWHRLAGSSTGPESTSHCKRCTGGVLLDHNPWRCSCSLLWLGAWQRRWLRETVRAHALPFDAALFVESQLDVPSQRPLSHWVPQRDGGIPGGKRRSTPSSLYATFRCQLQSTAARPHAHPPRLLQLHGERCKTSLSVDYWLVGDGPTVDDIVILWDICSPPYCYLPQALVLTGFWKTIQMSLDSSGLSGTVHDNHTSASK